MDVYFPIARMLSISILILLSIGEDLIIKQLDANKSAFLNRKWPKPSYIKKPEGVDMGHSSSMSLNLIKLD